MSNEIYWVIHEERTKFEHLYKDNIFMPIKIGEAIQWCDEYYLAMLLHDVQQKRGRKII